VCVYTHLRHPVPPGLPGPPRGAISAGTLGLLRPPPASAGAASQRRGAAAGASSSPNRRGGRGPAGLQTAPYRAGRHRACELFSSATTRLSDLIGFTYATLARR